VQKLFTSPGDVELTTENSAIIRGSKFPWETGMNLKTLKADFARNLDQLNAGLMTDAKKELGHIIDPAQCGLIVRRHFNGLMGVIYLFIILFLLSAVIGFALYARQ
jgi:hypothetical protein